MTISAIISLSFATAILGLSPGPAVFATIGRSLSQGLRQTSFFIAGIVIGDIVFALLAMVGLASLAASYVYAFILLKVIGGGYLIYIGVNNLKYSKAKRIKGDFQERGWKLVASGFLLTSTNPKDLLFFVGFLPAFINLESATYIDMFIASLTIAITFIVTLGFYALSADKMRKLLKSDNAVTNLNRFSGIVMIIVGLLVIIL